MNAPTIIQRLAHPRAVGRVTPCAPLLTSQRTSFPQPLPSQCFNLKKHIMQVPDFTTCYGGGRSRAATPSACGASTLRRGLADGSRMISPRAVLATMPARSKNIENPRNNTFYNLKHHERTHNHPTPRPPTGGRARHSVRAAIDIPADKLSPTAAIPMLQS